MKKMAKPISIHLSDNSDSEDYVKPCQLGIFSPRPNPQYINNFATIPKTIKRAKIARPSMTSFLTFDTTVTDRNAPINACDNV